MSIRVALSENYIGDSFDVFIVQDIDGNRFVWRDGHFEMVKLEDQGAVMQPSFTLPGKAIPELILKLQNLGRPSGKAYEQGQLDKMKDHLQDMRQLVFKGKQCS